RAGQAGQTAARVVSVSSRGHRICNVDFDDPHFMHRPYDKWQAYGQSKTANALFAVALDQRAAAYNVRSFSLHPGSIMTDLARHLSDDDLRALGMEPGSAPGHVPEGRAAGKGGDYKTVAQGAATSVWCAASTQLEGLGGVYCEDADIAPVLPADAPNSATGVRPWAMDAEGAERLWQLSEEMTGARLEE
ncbi:MAG: oxidoreductase, partial [Variovorax sp.]|nr:oxidoreductase [Variovorax sp.]